jgi:hypothetical protein
MDFEKIWNTIVTAALTLLIGLALTCIGISAFSSGKTDYCRFQANPLSEYVDVVEHRSFATNTKYTAPSFEDAMKYAAMACPNFQGMAAQAGGSR